MNFFESQDHARRNTVLLVALFVVAVAALVTITNVVVLLVTVAFTPAMREAAGGVSLEPTQFLIVGGIVAGLILFMSWLKIVDLAKGGRVVAERIGGQLLGHHGNNLQRRRLLNIVEEMAIASGVPVPPVYLVPEDGINAFAAGYTTGDAVIGVTQGALDNLDRAQLQAVIAHEFSHILNGDMRLNIRLMGVVSGLEFVSDFGSALASAQRTRRSPGSRDRDGGHPGFMVLGYALLAIGSLGRLSGSLIKAAVSRQREFLADASAVQFTRDKVGLRDALRRIGGYDRGSRIAHPVSHEMSHAFFSEGVRFRLARLTSTHPPLTDRIRRVDPAWRGGFMRSVPEGQAQATAEEIAMGFVPSAQAIETIAPDASLLRAWSPPDAPDEGGRAGAERAAGALEAPGEAGLAIVDLDADAVLEDIGHPDRGQLDEARRFLAQLPDAFKDAAHDPLGAQALICTLLLAAESEVRAAQLTHLERDAALRGAVDRLVPWMPLIDDRARMPLAEMAMPALRRLTSDAYPLFVEDLDALVRADARTSLREWALQKFVLRHLAEALEGRHPSTRYRRVEEVAPACAVVLSVLAHAGRQRGIDVETAFAAGRDALGIDLELLDPRGLGVSRLDAAVDALALLRPLRKPVVLKALIATVKADTRVTVMEAELLRAVADVIGCPMPVLAITDAQ